MHSSAGMGPELCEAQLRGRGLRYGLQEPAESPITASCNHSYVVLNVPGLLIPLLHGCIQVLPNPLQHLVRPLFR